MSVGTEGALQEKGFCKLDLVKKRKEIRAILFPAKPDNRYFLNLLQDIKRNGVHNSIALSKIMRKMASSHLIIWKEIRSK